MNNTSLCNFISISSTLVGLMLCFLFPTFVFANEVDSITLQKAHFFLTQNEIDSAAYYYAQSAKLYRKGENYAQADELYDQAIALFQKKAGQHQEKLVDCFIGKAYSKYKQGDFIAQQRVLEQALEICKEHNLRTHKVARFVFSALGNIYTRLGDYKRAIIYLEKARTIFIREKDENKWAQMNNDISIVYISQGKYRKAITILQKGLNLPSLKIRTRALLLNTLSECYRDQGNIQQALSHIIQVQEIFDALLADKKTRRKNLNWAYQAYATVADINAQAKRYAASKMYFEKAIRLGKELYGDANRREFSKLYINHGKMLFNAGKVDAAMEHYQKAIYAVLPEMKGQPNIVNPSFDQLYSENSIMEALLHKAEVFEFYFQRTNEKKYLDFAMDTYELVFKVEDLLWGKYIFESSKLTLRSESRAKSEKAIAVAVRLFNITGDEFYYERALHFVERNKSAVLKEGIQMNLLLSDNDLLKKEQQLKRNAYDLFMDREEQYDDHLMLEIESELEKVSALIHEKYQNHLLLNKKVDENIVATIRDNLIKNSEDHFISFFVGEKETFVFNIPKHGKPIIHIISSTPQLKDKIQDFLSFFEKASTIAANPDSYAYIAHELYDILLGNFQLPAGVSLIIAPDDILSFLPFQALITEKIATITKFETTPFLLYLHRVRYTYSASLAFNASPSKPIQNKMNLVMAPGFENEERGLARLKHSEKETAAIPTHNTQHFSATQASLQNFREHAPQSQFIYLSTHGEANADGEGPKIEFIDSSLYERDLYLMNLNCNLLILSACKTNLGELQKGEGAMSLARGFTYAGAQSLVASLWGVNENTTAIIMDDFIHNLNQGEKKAKALHHSQINFLQNPHISNLQKSPYYWAGFVFIGQDGTLELTQKKYTHHFLFLALFLLFSTLFFLYKKIKNKPIKYASTFK